MYSFFRDLATEIVETHGRASQLICASQLIYGCFDFRTCVSISDVMLFAFLILIC